MEQSRCNFWFRAFLTGMLLIFAWNFCTQAPTIAGERPAGGESRHIGAAKTLSGANSSASFLQGILNQVNGDSMWLWLRQLSGELPITIHGRRDTIHTRFTYGDDFPLLEDYMVSLLERWGYQVEKQAVLIGSFSQQDASSGQLPAMESMGTERLGKTFSSSVHNLIVTKKGSKYGNKNYVLGAHYDSISEWATGRAPGADDNASGTAAVLEAARILAHVSFETSVKFIWFAAEEQNLVGSHFYVSSAKDASELIDGAIILDMIAYDEFGDNQFDIHAGFRSESKQLAQKLVSFLDEFQLTLLPTVLEDNLATTRSDHASFWNAGYPAVLLFEGFWGSSPENPFYHSTQDLSTHLDSTFYVNVAKLAIGSLVQLARVDTSVSFVSGPKAPLNFRLGDPYPNPFNPSVTIPLWLERPQEVQLNVLDVNGRLVVWLHQGYLSAGEHPFHWDGRNANGQIVSSGIYFICAHSRSVRQIAKVMFVH